MAVIGEISWNNIKDNFRKMWDNKLGRPSCQLYFYGRDPGRAPSPYPYLSFANCADFSFTPTQIIDRFDYDFRSCEYELEGCPIMPMQSFGPGVAAAFMGCEFNNRPETVWFEPKKILPINEVHFEYDPDNIWLRRIKDIYIAGMERWKGEVVMGMTDLGGILDILASFRTSEGLLTDLYDEPEQVLRCVHEIQDMWFRYFNEINDIMSPCANGYTSWAGIYSEKPTYMFQSDFSYMIGPDMFAKFVAPEIHSSAARVHKPMYHLDGIGELPHLDQLLSMDTLGGIQWVPGDGEPMTRDWSELYRKITYAGKKIQALNGFNENMERMYKLVPCPDMIVMWQTAYPIDKKDEVRREAYKYGFEF